MTEFGDRAGGSLRAMQWVLVVDDEDLRLRVPLADGEVVAGSGGAADLVLDHPTVSRRHATLRVDDEGVRVADAGSSNGTRVDGQTISSAVRVTEGAVLELGSLTCRLEAVDDEEFEPALEFRQNEPEPDANAREGRTLSVGPVQSFAVDALPQVVTALEAALPLASVSTAAALPAIQAVGRGLFESLPCMWLEIRESARQSGESDRAVVFRAGKEPDRAEGKEGETADVPDAPIVIDAGRLELRVRFAPGTHGDGLAPLVRLAGRLAALAWPGPVSVSDRSEPARSADSDDSGTAGGTSDEDVPLPEPATVDPGMLRIYGDARKVARGDVGILIEGESGTGKELLALFVHAASARSHRPMVTLNCAALPSDLLEAELFGIEKGVATGVEARAGKFESASGGTLFLDEIGDMALETQAKILRVLQEGEVYRLGGGAPRPARVRVLAATHRDLRTMIDGGTFRLDLYHRIADCRFRLPPLRERLVDLPNLAAHFLLRAAQEQGVRARGISRAALETLSSFPWPGNVRQLQREMTRAALFLQDGELLQNRHLQDDLRAGGRRTPGDRSLKSRLESYERGLLVEALARHDGAVRSAAEELGIGRTTLYRRLSELNIEL